MTFEDIKKANETIKTTTISHKDKKTGKMVSKEYAEVNQRLKAYRMLYPSGTISTEIVSLQDDVVVFKASVFDEDGRLLGNGTAFERRESSFINETSYIENCETSAVGRALAMCGIGIDLSVASYEEVANAMKQQEAKTEKNETKCEVKKLDPNVAAGYPPREELIKIAYKHYPKGSDVHKLLLTNFDNAPSVEALTDYQLRAIYSKFGGR